MYVAFFFFKKLLLLPFIAFNCEIQVSFYISLLLLTSEVLSLGYGKKVKVVSDSINRNKEVKQWWYNIFSTMVRGITNYRELCKSKTGLACGNPWILLFLFSNSIQLQNWIYSSSNLDQFPV